MVSLSYTNLTSPYPKLAGDAYLHLGWWHSRRIYPLICPFWDIIMHTYKTSDGLRYSLNYFMKLKKVYYTSVGRSDCLLFFYYVCLCYYDFGVMLLSIFWLFSLKVCHFPFEGHKCRPTSWESLVWEVDLWGPLLSYSTFPATPSMGPSQGFQVFLDFNANGLLTIFGMAHTIFSLHLFYA